jgi:hypothetical protein
MNPLMIAGAESVNPAGRKKHSVQTITGKVERFLAGILTVKNLKEVYAGLKAEQKMQLLSLLMPYAIAKKSSESLSDEQVNHLYDKLSETIKNANEQTAKKAG